MTALESAWTSPHGREHLRAANMCLLVIIFCLFALTPAGSAAAEDKITVEEAHRRAAAGEVLLIDIRTPGEWHDTGVGEGAHAISMHLPGFAEKIAAVTAGDVSRPIALICARGHRSAKMAAALARLGYSKVLDVAEGMLGSSHGPGWLKRRLPVRPFAD